MGRDGRTRAELVNELRLLRLRLGTTCEDNGFIERVLESALCGIYVYNLQTGGNDYLNAQYSAITGWSLQELNAMSSADFFSLFHADDQAAIAAHMQQVANATSPEAFEIEYRFRRPDGRWIWCLSRDSAFQYDDEGRVSHFIGTFLDITHIKNREADRRAQASRLGDIQRMKSLGLLAGGIAHDFNNLLTGIMGYIDLAHDALPEGTASHGFVTEALAGTQQAAELIAQLLAYSGKGRFVVEPLDLSDLIESTARLLDVSLSRDHVVHYDLSPQLPAVTADAAQMRQVVMNLVINASEATRDESATIWVRTGVLHCDTSYLDQTQGTADPAEGPYVFVEVVDRGEGMDSTTLDRIFDPFFTTKDGGHGLGLAATLGIIRAHRGVIRCSSEPGQGTTIRVLLPAAGQHVEPQEALAPPDTWISTGVALVIDDEEMVRSVASRMLVRLGFDVLLASDGQQGLDRFREQKDDLRIVLLDMTMPKLNGAEVFRALAELDPHIPVIVMSGYSQQSLRSAFPDDGPAAFIHKPFLFTSLRDQVRKVLLSDE